MAHFLPVTCAPHPHSEPKLVSLHPHGAHVVLAGAESERNCGISTRALSGFGGSGRGRTIGARRGAVCVARHGMEVPPGTVARCPIMVRIEKKSNPFPSMAWGQIAYRLRTRVRRSTSSKLDLD